MDDKNKNVLKILVPYVVFGIVMAFAIAILIFWIYQDFANPITMSILIGVLVALAVKLFFDAVNREGQGGV